MQLLTLPESPSGPLNHGPIFAYVHARGQVLRLLPLVDTEPFRGLSGRMLFVGYAADGYKLSPIYWPEEHYSLLHSRNIVRHVGLLSTMNDSTYSSIYEIEHGGSTFLEVRSTKYRGVNSRGDLCPLWF
ncbi:hypothetical protein K503DRAFT_419892 [Rhizopogon vinicolor AM-OR11-026]|uniref:Uncharacterized protein n=1 Tax=Rhizopogon vinicolor AM-OR11-026 TaxID=1314800 RepID=A0A1B7MQA5_9AGAM|nr:hypothetical protein K503DRAFT_419892 [Rhizopogon vinicolor AM-OR11-026]